ncbi:chromate transporter [Virgibacillus sp. W0181]|uniref:chromate transporter n=1 Tax=Virgibacillus sp. W0181 TaxID=3391581 RepID=UPI003F45429F
MNKGSDVMHKDLFIAFFRAGMLGYGGGLSAIPLMHKEVVKTFKWMGDDEFSDVLALANTLPGPINTKLSGYIGWRLAGFWGLVNCISATVLPTALLMTLLLTVLNAYKDNSMVQGMSRGVLPIAGVMIGILAWDFIKKSKKLLGWLSTIVLTVISIVAMELLGIHPAFLIIGLILLALSTKGNKKEQRENTEDRQVRNS